ncbi:MAG: Enolase [Microgenomates bacterium OLB23]|nr:MAG: Enolase [Microgenomates bacterium OLB23]
MALIASIKAREILDSRGIPTLEGKLTTSDGIEVYAQIPSGESLGKHEGVELRDKDPKRYVGMGVLQAKGIINEAIAPKLLGVDTKSFAEIDQWLVKADGTKYYSKLGVNSLMLVSQLVFKANAAERKLPLYEYVNEYYNATFNQKVSLSHIPTPIYNMINGGKHGTKNLDFQEFHIVPSSSTPFAQTLEFAVSCYTGLKDLFQNRNADVSVSEEGGFTPSLFTNTEAFEIIKEVLVSKKIKIGVDIFAGVDCAPAYYYNNKQYAIKDQGASLNSKEYIDFIVNLVGKYNMIILEDPLQEDDMKGWKEITQQVGKQAYIVADDFVAGNMERLNVAIEEQACNAVLVKFNQVGTLSEMFAFVHQLRVNNMKILVSHRLGETTDATIADIAVGLQADFIKFGSPARGERIAKYNRLLEIETQLATI